MKVFGLLKPDDSLAPKCRCWRLVSTLIAGCHPPYRCSQVISLPYAADTSSDVLAYVSNASFLKKISYRRSNIANLAEIFHLSKDDRVFGVCLD